MHFSQVGLGISVQQEQRRANASLNAVNHDVDAKYSALDSHVMTSEFFKGHMRCLVTGFVVAELFYLQSSMTKVCTKSYNSRIYSGYTEGGPATVTKQSDLAPDR